MFRLRYALALGAMVAVAPAAAQTDVRSGLSNGSAAPKQSTPATLPSPISPVAETRDLNPGAVELVSVPDPKRALANLPVYSRGIDIGRVLRVNLDIAAAPSKIEIAFNSGRAPVWVDATHMRYDPNTKRIVTTASFDKAAAPAH